MRRTLAIAALLIAPVLFATVLPARAQVPEGQSCGGLLCDMGVIGHKTAPAPPAAPPALAPATPVAAPEAAAEPRVRHRKPVVAVRRPAPARTAAAPVAPRPVEAAQMPARVAPVRVAPAAARPTRAAGPVTIAPPTAPDVAVQMPAPRRQMFYFQSVDPTLQ